MRWTEGALAAVAGALLLAPPAARAGDDPGAVTAGFYAAYVAMHPMDAPDAALRAALAPFVTPALGDALRRAGAAAVKYTADVRNTVPPLIEGDPIASNVEGVSDFAVQPCTVTGEAATCPVRLRWREGGQAPVLWQDVAMLRRTGAGWRVDDIDRQGFAFGNKGSLRDALAEVGRYLDGPRAKPEAP